MENKQRDKPAAIQDIIESWVDNSIYILLSTYTRLLPTYEYTVTYLWVYCYLLISILLSTYFMATYFDL